MKLADLFEAIDVSTQDTMSHLQNTRRELQAELKGTDDAELRDQIEQDIYDISDRIKAKQKQK